MHERQQPPVPFSNTIFFLGIGVLISVPFFKTITHLPPYMGILFGLGLLWVITEILHAGNEERKHLRVTSVLAKIDLSSILFFLGILLAVAGLESIGLLNATASWLDTTVGNKDVIVTILGLLSAVIDNVPMVAATMGMYSLQDFPTDHKLWEMIAFCAGTGGSLLIIGSAAGVVVMGMEKIDFIWYLKNQFYCFAGLPCRCGYLSSVVSIILDLFGNDNHLLPDRHMLKIAFAPEYVLPLPVNHRFPISKYELIPLQLLHEGTATADNFLSQRSLTLKLLHSHIRGRTFNGCRTWR